jgi:hypothetical protein
MVTPTNVLVHVSRRAFARGHQLLSEVPSVRVQFIYPDGSVDVALTAEQARELSALLAKVSE